MGESKIDLETIRQAINELLGTYDLEGHIYEVREGLELASCFEGSTWDHPRVVRFGEIVVLLKEWGADVSSED